MCKIKYDCVELCLVGVKLRKYSEVWRKAGGIDFLNPSMLASSSWYHLLEHSRQGAF